MMKKFAAMLLALLLVPCAVMAEETAVSPLPFDFSAGHVANPDHFTDSTYEDASLSVQMERVWVGDAHFNVARVKIADASQLRTALAAPFGQKKTNKISTIARNNNAVLAIGGDYFGNEEGGYVVRMTETYRKKPLKSRDMLITDMNGDFHIIKNSDAEQLKALVQGETPIVNVFNFGPALIIDGELQQMPDKYNYNIRGLEPRCAIGQVGPLEYVLVVVDGGKDRPVTITAEDGTKKKSTGCTVETLAQFMADQGCQQAYNLDGGNSALMVFHGENYSQKSFSAERSVSDIIYFATAIDFGLDGADKE